MIATVHIKNVQFRLVTAFAYTGARDLLKIILQRCSLKQSTNNILATQCEILQFGGAMGGSSEPNEPLVNPLLLRVRFIF